MLAAAGGRRGRLRLFRPLRHRCRRASHAGRCSRCCRPCANARSRRHSQRHQVPDLEDPQLILKGAGQYAAMCTQCHLDPGMENSEIRPGLYPQPPNLSQMPARSAAGVLGDQARHQDECDAGVGIQPRRRHDLEHGRLPAEAARHDAGAIQDIVAKAPPDDDMDDGRRRPRSSRAYPPGSTRRDATATAGTSPSPLRSGSGSQVAGASPAGSVSGGARRRSGCAPCRRLRRDRSAG